MSGKKSSLNSRFRELLAKIQREFHFPKVFVIRCPIQTHVTPFQDHVPVSILTPDPLQTSLKAFSFQLNSSVSSGGLEEPQCLAVEPLEEAATQVQTIECYDLEELPAHQIQTGLFTLKPHTPPGLSIEATKHIVQTTLTLPKLRGRVSQFPTSVRTNTRRIHQLGISFPLTLMNNLPMRQLIRYRTAALRKTQMKSNQIDFIGVCETVPPAPLRFLSITTVESSLYAVGILRGTPDNRLGSQVWVIYRLRDTDQITATMIHAEE